MLNEYPVKFDNNSILNASSWSETYETKETVNETESGIDVVTVSRYDKLTVSASYKVTDSWLKLFKEYSMKPSISVKMYDPVSEAYKTRNMRMRNLKANLIRKSEKISVSNGLWEVSFILIEY